jgi:hypothetical protein
MITLITKFATNDFGMESSYVDSIPKSICANFRYKILKSTPTDFGVEFSIKYSTPKLLWANSKLEFIVQPKFPIILLKRCLSVESHLFDGFLLKSIELIIISSLVVLYVGSLMSTTEFF